MKLICCICDYEIAKISDDVKAPIQGSMFLSKNVKHGYPAPWNPVASWEYLYCPMCQKRPFHLPDENGVFTLKTDHGDITVALKGASTPDSIVVTADGVEKLIPNPLLPKVSEKEVQEPVPGTVGTSATADTSQADNSSRPADGDSSEVSGPLDSGFDDLLKSGEIVKKGSWYTYKGKSYRQDDLKEKLNG